MLLSKICSNKEIINNLNKNRQDIALIFLNWLDFVYNL